MTNGGDEWVAQLLEKNEMLGAPSLAYCPCNALGQPGASGRRAGLASGRAGRQRHTVLEGPA